MDLHRSQNRPRHLPWPSLRASAVQLEEGVAASFENLVMAQTLDHRKLMVNSWQPLTRWIFRWIFQLSQLSQLLSDEAVPPEVYVWRDVESCRRLVHRHMARRGNRAGPLGTDRKSLDLWRFEWEESIEILHKLIRIIYK